MLHHKKQRNSMHLQTVMQAIVICNPSRRSNSYTIYTCTLCRSMKIKLDRLRVKITTSDNGIQLDEEMHDDMLNMLQLSTSEVQHTLKDLFRESSGRSKRKWCFAKIPARCGGILWLSSSICTCDIGLVVPTRHFEVLVAEAALPTNSAWLHTLCESSCQV